jgi:hypothetical protein
MLSLLAVFVFVFFILATNTTAQPLASNAPDERLPPGFELFYLVTSLAPAPAKQTVPAQAVLKGEKFGPLAQVE